MGGTISLLIELSHIYIPYSIISNSVWFSASFEERSAKHSPAATCPAGPREGRDFHTPTSVQLPGNTWEPAFWHAVVPTVGRFPPILGSCTAGPLHILGEKPERLQICLFTQHKGLSYNTILNCCRGKSKICSSCKRGNKQLCKVSPGWLVKADNYLQNPLFFFCNHLRFSTAPPPYSRKISV